jgi:predicted TPR repeat methyltransferase
MDWARDRGHLVSGIDILPDMVAAARERGHHVHLGCFDVSMFADEKFDVICAFDVLEHMTREQLTDFLRDTQKVLSADGKFLFRFPDGQSPLSVLYQYGDWTHLSVMSAPILGEVASRVGLKLTRRLSIRPYPASIIGKARRWLAYRLQDVLEICIGLAFAGQRISLAPNATVVIERA